MLLISSLRPNYSVSQKISKQDVIDTIKNVESSLLSLDINSDLKNKIREKVTNNILCGTGAQNRFFATLNSSAM